MVPVKSAKRAKAHHQIEWINRAIATRDDFLDRVKIVDTRDDVARLMAEAIDMHLAANGLEVVGHDGRVRITMDDIAASHCLKAARDAYIRYTNAESNDEN